MRVLVVEDEIKTAKFLKKGLTEAGFVVALASDGLQGLHLALEIEFELIILDVMLPGMDGWEVLSSLTPGRTQRPRAVSHSSRRDP